jgi:hypothetical protein
LFFSQKNPALAGGVKTVELQVLFVSERDSLGGDVKGAPVMVPGAQDEPAVAKVTGVVPDIVAGGRPVMVGADP